MEHMKPRRLKIVEPAFLGYSGPLGEEMFENGVSVHPVSYLVAQRLGSVMQLVDAADETTFVSPIEEMRRLRSVPANNVQVLAVGSGVLVEGELVPASSRYTRADLEEIADKRGLTGLREIANPMGVGARAINDLIERILETQASVDAPTASPPPETPVSEETPVPVSEDTPAAIVATDSETPDETASSAMVLEQILSDLANTTPAPDAAPPSDLE